MKWNLLRLSIVSLSLSSCAGIMSTGGDEDLWKQEQKAALNAYQKAGGRLLSTQDTSLVTSGGVASQQQSKAWGITPTSDLVWAPENPNQPMSDELESLWKDPASKSWHTDFKVASKVSNSSGKPMMIWFTNSAKSPQCKALDSELFLQTDFEKWAREHVVRLNFDLVLGSSGMLDEEDATKLRYAEHYKKLYNVHGYPSVVLIAASGQVIDKYRGYKKGGSAYYWGRLKHAVQLAEAEYGQWREKLEARGYRMWTSRRGVKVFAKLHRYQTDKIVLIEPGGQKGVTSIRKLSDADQAWIEGEKKKYENSKGL
ncbi:MAG: thioredoxin fold domain-containing protein [Akkermansiaceae bacterium]